MLSLEGNSAHPKRSKHHDERNRGNSDFDHINKRNVCIWLPDPTGLFGRLGVIMTPPPPPPALAYRLIDACPRANRDNADPFDVASLLRIEEDLGAPKGLLVATWCFEAGLQLGAVGDHGKALGPFQMWPWFRRWCAISDKEAHDLEKAARCYWSRIEDRIEARGLAKCGTREDAIRVGEALAANGPKHLKKGCKAKSKHWVLYNKMKDL